MFVYLQFAVAVGVSSCVKVEVAILTSPAQIVLMAAVDVKQL